MPTYSSNTGNGYQLRLTLNVTSQNTTNNTSTVSWLLAISNGSTYYNARHTGNVVLGGTTVWNQPDATFNSSPSGAVKTISSGTRTVTHSSNGTMALSFSAQLRTINQGSSWSVPPLSLSGTYNLPTIPRLPSAPTAWPSAVLDHNARTYTVTSHEATSGAPILEYSIERRHNRGSWSSWTAQTANANRQISFQPGSAPVKFQFRSRARTVAGWGPYSAAREFNVVWKPQRLGPPTISENLSTRAITLTAPVASTSGSPITGYQIRRRDNFSGSGWTAHAANLNTRQYSFTPSKPLARFDFQARASTAAGWGDWSDTYSSIDATGSGPKVRSGGVYRDTNTYVKVDGEWKPALCYVKLGGVWRTVGR